MEVMKTTLLAALAIFVATSSVSAQVGTSPRDLTRRIEPQIRPQLPSARPQGGGGYVAAPALAAKAPLTPAEQEQKRMAQSAEDKKKMAWQLDRAQKGSDTAQLALGLRYLNAEGVDKDLKKAKGWLAESAKNGNPAAKKKLAETTELDGVKAEEVIVVVKAAEAAKALPAKP